jgi:hypothetical protein
LALPARLSTVAAGVTAHFFGFAIRTNRLAMPANLFQVLDALLLGFETIEQFDDVHGRPLPMKGT